MVRITELCYYPIKGAAGRSVSRATVTPAGLAHDRSFLVTTADGVFRSQRRDPRLALIHPEVTADGTGLTLRATGMTPLDVEVRTDAERRPVELFGKPFHGIDQGDAAALWVSEVLGGKSRLVRVPPDHGRVTDGVHPGTSGYADSSALHLVAMSTMDDLNRRITDAGGQFVAPQRFRPNLAVDGWSEPYTEDRIRRASVGDTELGYTKLAVRCAVTMVDQATGMKVGPEPLRTLARYRRTSSGGTAFGIKFSVLRTGTITIGDELHVTEWGDAEL